MGTWYVTIVVIIKYFWPDKEVTPGYVPTRCGKHFTTLSKHLHPPHLALFELLNHCVCYSSASWTAVFNAMPTICFGFQVSPHLVSFDEILSYVPLWLDFNINKLYLLPSPSWSPVTVPCQLRASVQQHEEERDQTLGARCDLQHVNLPFCLHWNRYCTYILNNMHLYNLLLNTFEKLHVKGTWRYFFIAWKYIPEM